MTKTDPNVLAGTALYTKFYLPFYDWHALKINCRYIWKCDSHHMLGLYDEHVSANHLDVGTGTGYFIDHCKFPCANPRIVLFDLNQNCLARSARRLTRYKPETFQGNVLDPVQIDMESFDSVGIMNLLHCLPGDMEGKGVLFRHVRDLLNPGAVLFGSTILGKGVEHSFLAKRLLSYCNSKGYMNNDEDDLRGLKESLDTYFSDSLVTVVGSVALFSARN